MPTCFPNSSATGSTRDLDSKATVSEISFLAALTSITKDFAGSGSTVVGDSADAGTFIRRRLRTLNSKPYSRMEPGCAAKPRSQRARDEFKSSCLVPPDVEPLPQTLEAIARADVITIGPGSLFTSLIPNLLVRGVTKAILDSPAIKIYICNLMTQANESLGLTAADHIRALNRHAQAQLFDYALINRTPASEDLES